MGGEIGFAVRWQENGEAKECAMLRWTNDLFWRIASVSFLEGGDALRELVSEAKADNSWPSSVLQERITRGEYGIVLADLINRRIFSRNDYSTVGRLLVMRSSTAYVDELQNAIDLYRKGWISRAERFFPSECEIDLDAFMRKAIAGDHRNAESVEFFLSEDAVSLDSVSNRYPAVSEVEAFLKSNGWNTPLDTRSFSREDDDEEG